MGRFAMAVAEESGRRSDSETAVVLASTSFACLFLVRQLFYVKKRPQFLPFTSISMLTLLTLGYLASLVQTLEALVRKLDQDEILFEAGGWLMADQVAISVVKFVAFLLQFYLLMLSWSARSTEETRIEIWAAEKKALIVTILLHVVVGTAAVVSIFASSENYELFSIFRNNLKSFGGLALDCFLLPQIQVNAFGDSEGKFLSFTFYMGTTAVRLVTRAYNLYRGDDRHFNASFIYENSNDLFYLSGWNMIVFSCSVLLAIVMFTQQNLGA